MAEVASIGGFQKQYQVNIDPTKLLAFNIPISTVVQAIRDGNNDVGGRLVEFSGAEYMVRGRGYVKSVGDIEQIVVGTDKQGTPILVRNLGSVTLGPDIRRGIADLDGEGDTVGGIVIMRAGENALNVIERVKEKLEDIKPSLPKGVEIVTTYDRSTLIERSIDTLKEELVLEVIIVSLVILVFLWHIPSAIIPILTIPVSVVLVFIPLYFMGLTSNIMSLTGIAISIGVLVDGAIVEVENAYKRLEEWNAGGRNGDFHEVRLQALKEVGPSVFFSLLVIAVAFLPVFALDDQEGRLFKPLAYTKNLAMAIAAILAITLDPAMRMMFTRMDYHTFRPRWLSGLWNTVAVGRYFPEEQHPISKRLFRVYEPACNFVLRHKALTLVVALILVLTTIPVYFQLGSEFMPPLYEGTLLYMPTTVPGISVAEAQQLLQTMDKQLREFPEVERVFGKAGRADTSTDPAPFSMMETTIVLKPTDEWRKVRSLVLGLPRVPPSPSAAHMARPHQPRRTDRGDGPGHAIPRREQCLDHADQGPHRHAQHRRADPDWHQDSGSRCQGNRANRHPSGVDPGPSPRHAERLRRADRGRLLPGLHAQAGEPGPLWPDDQGSGNGGPVGGGRRSRSPPPSRDANATRSTSATPASSAKT